MRASFRRICVFCGSSCGNSEHYPAVAAELGRQLALEGVGIVYGGGRVGLMGVLADSALAAGGEVVGVIPQALVARELSHGSLTELRVVPSMHARKAMMAELADAFIALPGGFGTFEEFCEIVTWGQLGIHRKPCGLLNVAGYYGPLLRFFDHAVEEGFLKLENRKLVLEAESCEQMLAELRAFHPAPVTQWIGRDQT